MRRIKTGQKLEGEKIGEVPIQNTFSSHILTAEDPAEYKTGFMPVSESLPILETSGQYVAEARGRYDTLSEDTTIGSDQMPVMDFFQRWAGTLPGGRTAF